MEWHVEIFGPAYGADLASKLNGLQALGWSIHSVLVNGVDRWTIICTRGGRL